MATIPAIVIAAVGFDVFMVSYISSAAKGSYLLHHNFLSIVWRPPFEAGI